MASLYLRFLGALVEELGERMYPSTTATMAELLSNAWDADAENVWVSIPLNKAWTDSSEIIVTDDGNGMSEKEAASRYLLVGHKRRQLGKDVSDVKGRRIHGRKGVGKLAAFGTARILELTSKSIIGGSTVAFQLDYDKIRAAKPGADVPIPAIAKPAPIRDPDGKLLKHGTRIVLRKLKLVQPVSDARFVQSMSRRFALSSTEMRVWINGKPLKRFNVKTRFRFPPDGTPDNLKVNGDLIQEEIDGRAVKWWIGFTPLPVGEEDLRGVSVMVRGKMAQRPFMFQRSQGTEGQIGQEYLVGEVFADWIDDDPSVAGDLISTNRAELMVEDARLKAFLEWGRKRLRWALRKRQELIEEHNIKELELSQELQERLKRELTLPEQRVFKGIAARLSKIPEIAENQVTSLMLELLDGHSDRVVRDLIDSISATDPQNQDVIWPLVAQFGLIDARRQKSVIEARLEVIEKLAILVKGGAKEVPDIHVHLRDNYWLLDPRWQLMDDEKDLIKFLQKQFGLGKVDSTGHRLDFVYCLGPTTSGRKDAIFLIEIKRGTDKSGTSHKVTAAEINRFHEYYVALTSHLSKADSHPPTVHAILIAADYASQAMGVKASFEKLGLEFKSWRSVLDESRRLHAGWYKLSERRIQSNALLSQAT